MFYLHSLQRCQFNTPQIKFAVNTHGKNKDWKFRDLSGKFQDKTGTLDDVQRHIQQGHALCAGLLGGKWRSKANVIGSNWILIDIDNSGKDEQGEKGYQHQMTLDEAIDHPFIQKCCALIYTTASHRSDWHKFRLIFPLPEIITDIDHYEGMVRLLMQQLPHDPACKDASRVFYGSTAAEFPLVNPSAVLPSAWVDQAIAFAEAEKSERAEREKLRQIKREQFRQVATVEGWDIDTLIKQALDFIPPRQPGSGNYNECCQVLMALDDFYGSTEAEAVAETWSPSIKGSPWNINRKIKSFRRSGITIGTLFYIAKQYGFKFPKPESKIEWGAPDPDEYNVWVARQNEQEQAEAAQAKESVGNAVYRALQHTLEPKQPKRTTIEPLPQESYQTYVPGCMPYKHEAQEKPAYKFEEEQATEILVEAVCKGWTDIGDATPPGGRKSTRAGRLKPELFSWLEGDQTAQASHIFYLDANHRNVSTDTVESNFVDLPARHNGLAIDRSRQTPLGSAYLRHPKEGDGLERTISNCERANDFKAASEKGLRWADDEAKANPICRSCRFFGTCGKEESIGEPGQGFRAERRQALQAQLIRMHPDSVPDGFADRLQVWEEATALFEPEETLTASLKDLEMQWGALESADKDAFDRLAPVREVMRRMIADPPLYGFNTDQILSEIGAAPAWLDDDRIAEIADTICPSVQDLLGEPDKVDTSEQTKEIQSLRSKIKRLKTSPDKLRAKRSKVQAEIAAHESKVGATGLYLADKAKIRKLRDRLAQIDQQLKEVKPELVELEAKLEKLEDDRQQSQQASRMLQAQERAEGRSALYDAPVQWLDKFLRVWAGVEPGAIRIIHGRLVLTTRNQRYLQTIRNAKANIYLDGTLDRYVLSANLGISPESLLLIQQNVRKPDNLRRVQVMGFGNAGKLRAASTDERINAVINAICQQEGIDRQKEALVIDHHSKKEVTGAELHHFGGRGSNEFRTRRAVFIAGLPAVNLGAAQDRYRALGQVGITFEQYYQQQIYAELIQEENRLRAISRPDEDLLVVYINDHALPFEDVEIRQAINVIAEAGDRTQAAQRKIFTTIADLANKGIKLTQAAIAAAAGVAQSWISQFFAKYGGWERWRKIISDLVCSSNRVTYISVEQIEALLPEEAEMAGYLEESAIEAAAAPQEFLEDMADMAECYEASTPGFSLGRVFAVLSRAAKQAIVAAFTFCALPELENRLLLEVT